MGMSVKTARLRYNVVYIHSWYIDTNVVSYTWYILLRTCITGKKYSTRPSDSDGRSHRYRATDILISLGGPEARISSALKKANIT